MIYLDHNATAPVRPQARDAMLAALDAGGNASSVHAAGRKARGMIDTARDQVAALMGAKPAELVFTGGGTEAAFLGLHGAIAGALADEARITRLFVSAIEHNCVRVNAVALGDSVPGLRVETLPVTGDGVLDTEALRVALREGKGRALVAVMAANNETGVIQPLEDIRALTSEAGALFLCDAVQSAGKADLAMEADYVAISAHKLGGPQGVGALIVKEGAPYLGPIRGGGHEQGRRAGTQNTAAIAGFGAVAALDRGEENARIARLRNEFERDLKQALPQAVIFGEAAPRLGNTTDLALPGVSAQTAAMALDLDGIMVSSGSACSSGKVAASHVLAAMGVDEALALGALRISFGWNSNDGDGAGALAALKTIAARTHSRTAA